MKQYKKNVAHKAHETYAAKITRIDKHWKSSMMLFNICIKSFFFSCYCLLISNLLQEKSVIKNTLFGDKMAMKKTHIACKYAGSYIHQTFTIFFFIYCTFKKDLRESEACLSSTRKPNSLV